MPPLPDVAERARRRIARRLLPYLFLLYVIAFLDRVNVAYAALDMTRDLGFTPEVFGFGAGIFFIGYFLLEIPGALLVEKWSARGWIARILITWGMVTLLVGLVKTAHQFYWARFFLGLAEAGFFPGIIVYLTHWFRAEDRAKAVALFMAAVPVSNILGAPLAGLILEKVRWAGLPGWRWIFILEGIPAVVFGVITIFYLTDRPQQARWLPEEERQWILAELEREKLQKKAVRSFTVWQALRSRDVIVLALVYFFGVTGSYGVSFWLPTMIQRLSGLPNMAVTLLAAIPYLIASATMVLVGWSSDRSRERRWHTALPLFAGGAALALSVVMSSQLVAAIALLTVATACVWTYLPSFWALPTAILSEAAAAASIGLINSIGNLGGFVGPYAVGKLQTATGSTGAGMTSLVISLILSGFLVLSLRPLQPASRNHRESPMATATLD
ncbi:MAG: MFS transporter [Acidobacteria bacterium]|nr:MFS transporter [Acidobacteriota bacterium]